MNTTQIKHEFVRSRIGMAGICILGVLIGISVFTIVGIPQETLKQWNNPTSWILYPKAAMPLWVNYLQDERIPEHQIIKEYSVHDVKPSQQMDVTENKKSTPHLLVKTIQHDLNFDYTQFPDDFMYILDIGYAQEPVISITVKRPDNKMLKIAQISLPYTDVYTERHTQHVFSTDAHIKKNVFMQADMFEFDSKDLSPEEVIFSKSNTHKVLPGTYTFTITIYEQKYDETATITTTGGVIKEKEEEKEEIKKPTAPEVQILQSQLVVGGKVFGVMGTDEMRRDLAVGLFWGTPIALFIGIAVSIGSVVIGLIYGVYAGFWGNKTEEAMMRLNDIVYALPALPFLIILAATISSNVFVIIGFLTIFGWVGIAKISRSMTLQIKSSGYVQAAKMMGQKKSKIIFKHILPQLLPYAFASIAISVPAAITTEAGLSFLGLGDPSFPTWGQILHDANTHGAVTRGLWWWIIPPGIMIAITGLAFVFIGNALDVIANPKLRKNVK